MDDTLRVRTRICITMYISKYPVIAATVTESACVCYTSWMARESRGQNWKAVINAGYRTVRRKLVVTSVADNAFLKQHLKTQPNYDWISGNGVNLPGSASGGSLF